MINWDLLVDSIRNEKCVLFLGPGITINYGDPLRLINWLTELQAKKPEEILAFHKHDGLLVFNNGKSKASNRQAIQGFYQQDFTKGNSVLEKIADIPFHLIISVTPDLTLQKVFEKKKFLYETGFCSKRSKIATAELNKEIPLIFNLFGSEQELESLIVAHSDLYNFG